MTATHIFVISLANSTQRRASFAALADTRLQWRFFDAHTTLSAALDYDPDRARRLGGRRLGPGELGCYSSHVALWRRLAEDPEATRYLIFEDDVTVDWPFVERLVETETGELANSGLLRLYFSQLVPGRTIMGPMFEQYALVELQGYSSGAAAYLIDKPTAARLLEEAERVILPIDWLMEAGWRHGVPNRAVFPPPVFHPMNQTQLGRARFTQVERSSPGLKLLRAVVRGSEALRRALWWRLRIRF